MLSKKAKERLTTFTFLAPWIILFAIFSIYPLAFSIIVSLSRYSGLNPHMEFVGLSNYIKAFQDEAFLTALKNTFVFVVGTIPFTTAISLFMAILINDKLLPMREFFQAGFFLPSVISMVVISLIWLYLYSADGPFNIFFAKWEPQFKASAHFMQNHGLVLWLILYVITFLLMHLLDSILFQDIDTKKNRVAIYVMAVPLWYAAKIFLSFFKISSWWLVPFLVLILTIIHLVLNISFKEKLPVKAEIWLPIGNILLFELLLIFANWINEVILKWHNISFLARPETALPSIMVMDVWSAIGYYTLLFIAGLRSIPEDVYEAARIDGANRWQMTFKITLPLLKPTLFFIIAINTIRSFQIFTEIFTMTQGGPRNSTITIVYYLYDVGFRRFEMGYASAIAYILFGITMAVTLIQKRFLRSDV